MSHTLDEILAAARKYGLQLTPEHMELNDSGLDFVVAHAVDTDGVPWVVRVPRRPDVVAVAGVESRVLELVREYLPVAVPEWTVNTSEVIAYRRLPGTPAALLDAAAKQFVWHIDPDAPSATFLESLAQAMASLHGIPHEAAAQAGLRVQQPDEVRRSLAEKMDKTRELLKVPDAVWARWHNWLSDDTYWPPHSAFIHGDLHPGHILVDEHQRVSGLLDWTEAEVGDPATDFLALRGTLGASAFADLLQYYRKAGGRVWPWMQDHLVELQSVYPVTIAMFVLRSGQDAYLEFARELLAAYEAGAA